MQEQVVTGHYVTFSQQLRDRVAAAHQQKEEEARAAKAKAGPHPINEQAGLDAVLAFLETAMWEAAGRGESLTMVRFLDVPLLAERNAYLETNFPAMAKRELREAVNYAVVKFKESHPDFQAQNQCSDSSIMGTIESFRITW